MAKLKITQALICGGAKMKTARVVSLIVLVISIFFSVDLGLNFVYSLIPDDGIGNICVINVFGDDSWSQLSYFLAFQKSLWCSFVILVENIVLAFVAGREK